MTRVDEGETVVGTVGYEGHTYIFDQDTPTVWVRAEAAVELEAAR